MPRHVTVFCNRVRIERTVSSFCSTKHTRDLDGSLYTCTPEIKADTFPYGVANESKLTRNGQHIEITTYTAC